MRLDLTVWKRLYNELVLKYLLLCNARPRQSIKKCLTDCGQLQKLQIGWFSRRSKQACVTWLWPILRRCRMVSSRLQMFLPSFVSPRIGLTTNSLLVLDCDQLSCHVLVKYVLIVWWRSVYGMLVSGVMSSRRAALAAASARSFPAIPTCDGIQQNLIVLWPSWILWIRSRICKIMGLSHLCWSIACKHDIESEKIKNLVWFVKSIMSSARVIAVASALNTDASAGSRLKKRRSLPTAAAAVLWWSFDKSVYIYESSLRYVQGKCKKEFAEI